MRNRDNNCGDTPLKWFVKATVGCVYHVQVWKTIDFVQRRQVDE